MNNFVQNDLKPVIKNTVNPRIGVITLATDFTIEQDFRKICNGLSLDLFFNRIPFINPLNHKNYLKMADLIPEVTKQILPKQRIDVIAYGCTSGTIAIGEDKIKNQVHKSKPDSKVTTPISAAIKAFTKLNFKNIAVLTPYPRDVNITVYNYLKKNNFNIDSFSSFNLNYDSDIAKISSDSILDGIDKINLKKVDGLFVSCTALKILDILDEIEKKYNTTIISSNQAIIWDCLRILDIKKEIHGYGKLFNG